MYLVFLCLVLLSLLSIQSNLLFNVHFSTSNGWHHPQLGSGLQLALSVLHPFAVAFSPWLLLSSHSFSNESLFCNEVTPGMGLFSMVEGHLWHSILGGNCLESIILFTSWLKELVQKCSSHYSRRCVETCFKLKPFAAVDGDTSETAKKLKMLWESVVGPLGPQHSSRNNLFVRWIYQDKPDHCFCESWVKFLLYPVRCDP